MSAELLREAAASMRARAEAATPGPWISRQEHGRDYCDEGWSYVAVTSASAINAPDVAATAYPGDGDSDLAIEDAEHIASWHPAVAMAVADWLEVAAKRVDVLGPGQSGSAHVAALVVATAYLGADQ